ncbi:MAG: hypothetical protein JST30_14555 [Armatimonadetes bacterium]|nr:hypothetical protein [Armatimonadota bacterium]
MWRKVQPQPDDPQLTVWAGRGHLAITGDEGERFVHSVFTRAGQLQKNRKPPEAVYFAVMALNSDPSQMRVSPIAMKLFFGEEEAEGVPYAEAYLNVDVPHRRLQFNEKATDYRTDLLKFLDGSVRTSADKTADR